MLHLVGSLYNVVIIGFMPREYISRAWNFPASVDVIDVESHLLSSIRFMQWWLMKQRNNFTFCLDEFRVQSS